MKNYMKAVLGAAIAGTFTGAAVFVARKLAQRDNEAQLEAEKLLDEETTPEIDRTYTTIPAARSEAAGESTPAEEEKGKAEEA